ncbi:hypothetical protein, conserved [Babesia bigemina]|uniref:Uncharacterized protein n=1 Tax=Babesia bigemina TaxID=5866 RepID=A0A061DA44_BABBI|nr:hypothetical protein, conserved [Babesia bigemina]CDR96812.1 hypothetical protein, conserved [Babesia bigemina]|eukprot:XP_012768998.1 hypothetical protein, conserved [Babesia bigemina]
MKWKVPRALRAKVHAGVAPNGNRRPAHTLKHMPFADDFMCARLPTANLGVELVKGAFLGFRRHAVNRFLKALALHGNEVHERSRLVQRDDKYAHDMDAILQIYLERMPLDQLLVLYQVCRHSILDIYKQINLKCATVNSEIKYSFIEAVSQKLVQYMRDVTSHETIGHYLKNATHSARTRCKRYEKELCEFLIQTRHNLLKTRKEVFEGAREGNPSAESFVTFERKRINPCHQLGAATSVENTPSCIKTKSISLPGGATTLENDECSDGLFTAPPGDESSVGDVGMPVNTNRCATESSQCLLEADWESVCADDSFALTHRTMTEDCFLSTDVMGTVLGHMFAVKFWHRGFPFHTWINQYFVHNSHIYHPLFARLYMTHIVALIERNTNPVNLDALCDVVKQDIIMYGNRDVSMEEMFTVRTNGYLHEVKFGIPEMIEMFSSVKRLSQNAKLREVYVLVVKALSDVIVKAPVDAKVINTIANICNRNDGVGGVESLLYVLESKLMSSLDAVTCMDVCSLLQALHKHDLHSQDVVDAMADKLDIDNLDELSMSTIALSIQTLGRMQAHFKNNNFLHRIANMLADNPQKFYEASESNCSGILWGLYKLHFKHPRFLEMAVQRYSAKELGTPNVNSLVISLTALTRLDSFTHPSVLVEIYKLILRNISSMTISTSQQLVTCVTRMLENITLCCSDQTSYKTMRSISNKLINAAMKHVCERLVEQINTAQAGAMLNALYRSKLRAPDLIAPLIASIAGAYKKGQDWQSSLHMPRKSIYSYDTMPDCPFDIEACGRKLEKVEITHLVGICEAIYGLDYWTPYSLNLMMQLQKHIKPQLHDMKATHILAACLSFSSWPFTDTQMEPINPNNAPAKRSRTTNMMPNVRAVVEHDLAKTKERSESWLEANMLQPPSADVLSHFRKMLMRSQLKEDFLLRCIESLHRHANFLCAASMPLRRLKIMYDMLRYNIYLDHYDTAAVVLPTVTNEFASTKCPFLILEHNAPVKPSNLPIVMPQNLIEYLEHLYGISRTQSFHNFIFEEGSAQNGGTNGVEEEDEIQMEALGGVETISNGKEVPRCRPLYSSPTIGDGGWDLESSSYHNHQGSGAIFHFGDNYMYVDPVIGGFRTTILLLNAKRHNVPHLVHDIYKA